jgi:hypothetical protein
MRRFYDGYMVLTYFEKVNEYSIFQQSGQFFGILPSSGVEESTHRLQVVALLIKLGVI